MEYFGIRADVDLELMAPGQSLSTLTSRALDALTEVIVRVKPDCVVVQGDTTTVMAASLASFYLHVPLVHVEAGLRTGDLQAPWPEELNRRIASLTAAVHCAPTPRAAKALLAEGAPPASVHVTGNTVIDALLWTVEREKTYAEKWTRWHAYLADRPLVLITGHRRENFGHGLENLCQAIARLAVELPNVQFIYPVHLNPNVQRPVKHLLANRPNVHLLPPLAYPEFVWLMDRAALILTDSGGIQEEAPSLGKRVLVMRDVTERPEALETGLVELIGADAQRIVERVRFWLDQNDGSNKAALAANPFGDGRAAERIVDLIASRAWQESLT
jgi:UDP-N-acetylglucosamine 2-epimerase (non-hydrolysing)